MKLKTFLTVTAVIYIPFGIAMILIPNLLFGFYGFELGQDGIVLGRVVGSAIVGLGLINFISRNQFLPSTALKAILMGNLIYHSIDICIIAPPTYQGTLNGFTWSFVGLHITLAFAFGYFYIKQ